MSNPFCGLFRRPRTVTITKHQEFTECYRSTTARHANNIHIRTRGRDAFHHERQRAASSIESSYLVNDLVHTATGRPTPRRTPNYLTLTLHATYHEFRLWIFIFYRASFRVPPLLAEIPFDAFWNPVVRARRPGQPCLRTLYTLADNVAQAMFKEAVLYLAAMQWLCAGGISAQWIRMRRREAVGYYGLAVPGPDERDYASERLAKGVVELVEQNVEVFRETFGEGARIQMGGGRRVEGWAGKEEVHGVATWDGGGPCGVMPPGEVANRVVYLPDVLLTRQPGLWASRVAQDGEFARAMKQWGGVSVVGSREEYFGAYAVKGANWVYVVPG